MRRLSTKQKIVLHKIANADEGTLWVSHRNRRMYMTTEALLRRYMINVKEWSATMIAYRLTDLGRDALALLGEKEKRP